jgi:phosphoglycolate phosphatase-like HAD superfamily hydrolase
MNANIKTKLIWDIDGTLLRTNGAAAIPFAKAVSEFAGIPIDIDRKSLSGFTDYEIAIHLLKLHDIPFKMRDISQILTKYVQYLPRSLNQIGVELINDIDNVLEKLSRNPDIQLLIGTGNCLEGALTKLQHVGLDKFFLRYNLYCSSEDLWSRDLIIQKVANSLLPNETGIVIGDSPKDISSAKNAGLRVIAVSTGAHSYEELISNQPTKILKKNWEYSDLIIAVTT